MLEARRITGVVLDAALPMIFAELANQVRGTEAEPDNPFSYKPSDDDSVGATSLTEVVHAAVDGALPWGEWLARTRAADFIAGGSVWPTPSSEPPRRAAYITGMTTFNEADHPRVATGQFTDKPQSAPEVGLGVTPAQQAEAAAAAAWQVANAAEKVAREASARAAALKVLEVNPNVTHVTFSVDEEGLRYLESVSYTEQATEFDVDDQHPLAEALETTRYDLDECDAVAVSKYTVTLAVAAAAALPEYTPAAEPRLPATGTGEGATAGAAAATAVSGVLNELFG